MKKNMALLMEVVDIVRCAGLIVMDYFCSSNMKISHKQDLSPVTEADIEAEKFIIKRLNSLDDRIPTIGEESCGQKEATDIDVSESFWLIDPIDGTRAFIKGNDEFTVNVGLIENKLPMLGCVLAPAQDICYAGAGSMGALKKVGKKEFQPIRARKKSTKSGQVIIAGHGNKDSTRQMIPNTKINLWKTMDSSIKFCYLAEGKADIYPRQGNTREWDTAAGHALLKAAQGQVLTLNGKELIYGKKGFINPSFIAYGKSY